MPATPRFITSHDWLVSPWYSQLEINGQAPPSDLALPRPPDGWTACQGTKLTIFTSGEDNLRVRIHLESWTAEPIIENDHAEIGPDTRTLAVPSAEVTVSDGEASIGVFKFPAPGEYHVRVTGHGMDAAQLYRDAEQHSADFDDPQFQADWAMLIGKETYILRFWPTR